MDLNLSGVYLILDIIIIVCAVGSIFGLFIFFALIGEIRAQEKTGKEGPLTKFLGHFI